MMDTDFPVSDKTICIEEWNKAYLVNKVLVHEAVECLNLYEINTLNVAWYRTVNAKNYHRSFTEFKLCIFTRDRPILTKNVVHIG